MNLFDTVTNKISKTSQGVIAKTKQANEQSKLKSLIEAEQSLRKEAIYEVGNQFYNLTKHATPEYEALFEQIKKHDKKIYQLKEQLTLIKGIRQCPQCGYEVKSSAVYCGQCGLNIVSYLNQH